MARPRRSRTAATNIGLAVRQPESGSEDASDSACPALGGTEAPTGVRLRAVVRRGSPDTVDLSVSGAAAPLVGYAQKVVDPVDGQYPYSPVGSPKANSPTFSGTWLAGTDAGLLPSGNGTMLLAASTCLSGAFPAGRPDVVEAAFRSGRLVSLSALRERPPPDADELSRTACSGTPR